MVFGNYCIFSYLLMICLFNHAVAKNTYDPLPLRGLYDPIHYVCNGVLESPEPQVVDIAF